MNTPPSLSLLLTVHQKFILINIQVDVLVLEYQRSTIGKLFSSVNRTILALDNRHGHLQSGYGSVSSTKGRVNFFPPSIIHRYRRDGHNEN